GEEIHLVEDQEHGRADEIERELVLGAEGTGDVGEQERQVAAFEAGADAAQHFAAEVAAAAMDAGGIDEDDLAAGQVEDAEQMGAGGLGMVGDGGDASAEEGIDQRALAGVGAADQGHEAGTESHGLLGYGLGEEERGGGGHAADQGGLEGGAERGRAGEAALDVAEQQQRRAGDADRGPQRGAERNGGEVGGERDEAAGDVGSGNGDGAGPGAAGLGGFEAELEAHHEVAPGGGALGEALDHGHAVGGGEAVGFEDLGHLAALVVGALDDLALFARQFAGVMLGVAAGGEEAAQAHGDRAGGNFGQAGGDHDAGGEGRAAEASGEGEGDGEAVGHADDQVADAGAAGEVVLGVGGRGHEGRGGGRAHRGMLAKKALPATQTSQATQKEGEDGGGGGGKGGGKKMERDGEEGAGEGGGD